MLEGEAADGHSELGPEINRTFWNTLEVLQMQRCVLDEIDAGAFDCGLGMPLWDGKASERIAEVLLEV
jgi:hypothetical protein